jgi:heme-degrading monooxygenase HmoA
MLKLVKRNGISRLSDRAIRPYIFTKTYPQAIGETVFIAMNRFKVVPGSQADFEQVWTTRDTHLRNVPGFINFHLLRGPDREDHTLYSSHSIWHSRADFEAWTRSEAFRRAHNTAGSNKPLYLGHPEFEGFEVLQTVEAARSED